MHPFPTLDASSTPPSSLPPLLLEHLSLHGACLVTNLLPPATLRRCNAAAELLPLQAPEASLSPSKRLSPGYVESSSRRYHLPLGDCRLPAVLSALSELEAALAPLLPPFFAGAPHGRTQLQLLRSEPSPSSRAQRFHQDNTRRGLTFLVPLVDVPLRRGPTELLLGSHELTCASRGSAAALRELPGSLPRVARASDRRAPPLRAGDVLVYDCRVLHRGLANRDKVARPVLVLRFDEEGWGPPGHGVLSTLVFAGLGRALAALRWQ
ncbi:hypothetical protein TeGR_g1520 [Tetraparma gracilis]|uniref:Phytanoyl-CoA dioxygenase n=1 Tax=Tetraparma gracilis TaxID=2962635 RepID=A0ABQ6MZG5_9STRA|nr:hypothetical protein TeGR_g1520 [Tetraparma gracilis]